ncbi:hypothetical protein WJX72_005403 [[Myrmecia] bisecta]|uniref:Codanin-1 C-terminal domain-containing protein n=1 Tax=[Myrmecia] bisecta TaxID=41462 RepID=A0AAW1QFP4_9CHLO
MPGALDTDNFPSLAAASSSNKPSKGIATASHLYRLVTPAPPQTQASSSAQADTATPTAPAQPGNSTSQQPARRKIAPTKVAPSMVDERFTAASQPAPAVPTTARRKIAPTPLAAGDVVQPQASFLLAATESTADTWEQRLSATPTQVATSTPQPAQSGQSGGSSTYLSATSAQDFPALGGPSTTSRGPSRSARSIPSLGNNTQPAAASAQSETPISRLPAKPHAWGRPAAADTAAASGSDNPEAEGSDPPHDSPEAEAKLPDEGVRMAAVHAHLLASVAAIALAAELDLLLHLLALPASLRCGEAGGRQLLWCSDVAAAYACKVLQEAGCLATSLGPQMLETLVESPAVAKHSPPLLARLLSTLERAKVDQLHTEKAYESVKSARLLSLFGLPSQTNDGQGRGRSQEEQRKLTNRESCRDEWFALMRDAAKQGHSFSSSAAPFSPASQNGRLQSVAEHGAVNDEAVLSGMQERASALLRRLRPDNTTAFAELLVAAILQAAATGETLMDEELTQLARRDVSKFHRLNQRLQAQAPRGALHSAARRPTSPALPSPSFSGTSALSRAGTAGRPRGGGPIKGGSGEEGVAATLAVVAEFPPAQRLYVLFLEAADSHRLNTCVVRCMAGKLRALMGQGSADSRGSRGSGHSERLGAMATLATFLSYLTFTGTAACESADGIDAAAAAPPVVDVDAALSTAQRDGVLHLALPWVVRLLWFLKRDASACRAPYYQSVLLRLLALHRAPLLRPQHARFGLAAFCMRSILDDFWEHLGGEAVLTARNACSLGPEGVAEDELRVLEGINLDARYMQQCCPALEACRAALLSSQAEAEPAARAGDKATAVGAKRPRGMRKITPSMPASAAPQVAMQIPAAVTDAVGAGQDGLKLRLQRAFLEQYSTDEYKVRLKDLVDYIADIVAFNAATAASDSAIPLATQAAARKLAQAAAEQLSAFRHHTASLAAAEVRLFDGGEGGSRAPAVSLTAEQLRARLASLAERLIAEASTQALAASHPAAVRQIETNAARALAALALPSWGEAVVGTAAAIVAEVATSTCTQRLLKQVPSRCRR